MILGHRAERMESDKGTVKQSLKEFLLWRPSVPSVVASQRPHKRRGTAAPERLPFSERVGSQGRGESCAIFSAV